MRSGLCMHTFTCARSHAHVHAQVHMMLHLLIERAKQLPVPRAVALNLG